MIFLDPPYDQGLAESSLEIIAKVELLNDSGRIVAEHSAREVVKSHYDKLALYDQRQYGDTFLSFFRHETKTNPTA